MGGIPLSWFVRQVPIQSKLCMKHFLLTLAGIVSDLLPLDALEKFATEHVVGLKQHCMGGRERSAVAYKDEVDEMRAHWSRAGKRNGRDGEQRLTAASVASSVD